MIMDTIISPIEAVNQAFDIAGGPSAVARAFGITPWAASKWRTIDSKTGMPKVPANRCRKLEELSGGKIKSEQMRPDVFMCASEKQEAA